MTSAIHPIFHVLAIGAVLITGACSSAKEPSTASTTTTTAPAETTTTTAGAPVTTTTAVSFASCAAASDAGYHDMTRGAPGYSSKLDGDGDGIACDQKVTTTTRPKATTTTTVADNKVSMRVGNMTPAECDAYAAKQSRLNEGPAWTGSMDGTTCVVTQG